MGTLYSDIYIDGVNSEVFAVEGAQIKEAWLDGECIWKLGSELTIDKVYQVVHHDGMYYVLFHAGELLSTSGTATTWRNASYYIGRGSELGVITDIEEIENTEYKKSAINFMAQECDDGLFVYYAGGYDVAKSYMYYENYDIHAEKDIIDKNPFGTKSKTLNSGNGLYLNGVITDKYIFYRTYDKNYDQIIRVTDLAHNQIKDMYPPEEGALPKGLSALYVYLLSAKGCDIYLPYYYEIDQGHLQYTILDTELLEYRKAYFDYSSMQNNMLDALLSKYAELGYVYEKPSTSEITSTGYVEMITALSDDVYIQAVISFKGTFVGNGCASKKEISGRYTINTTKLTYMMIDETHDIFDVGNGYAIVKRLEGTSSYPMYLAHGLIPLYKIANDIYTDVLDHFYENIKSVYKKGLYVTKYGQQGENFLVDYSDVSCTATELPEIEIMQED